MLFDKIANMVVFTSIKILNSSSRSTSYEGMFPPNIPCLSQPPCTAPLKLCMKQFSVSQKYINLEFYSV